MARRSPSTGASSGSNRPRRCSRCSAGTTSSPRTIGGRLLGRTTRSCGAPEVISSTSARAGESVAVPPETRPGRFVIVRITGFPDGILDRLRTLVFRADEWYVELPDRGRFRLVPGTADDGLILAVPAGLSTHPVRVRSRHHRADGLGRTLRRRQRCPVDLRVPERPPAGRRRMTLESEP